MNHVLHLAWSYLKFHWMKTLILVLSISLIVFIPLGLQVIVDQASDMLSARAASTPLLVGAKGSAVDLGLSALYFKTPNVDPVPYKEVSWIIETGFADAIPLHLRYTASGKRIVGTTTDYFEFRGMVPGEGRLMAILGECVLGARVAEQTGLAVDSSILSSPAGAFDVAGSYPLKMRVVGVLKPTGTPDDDAVFVDLKTAWVISGLAHGHMNMTTPEAESGVLERQEENVVANASVLSYTEITRDNIDSFHFHGDPDTFPVDAVIAVPKDRRSGLLLRGRYEERTEPVQILVPLNTINELMETVLSVRDFVILGSIGVGMATLATAVLVFMLSIRLRKKEIETIRKIGGNGRRLRAILASEILLVVAMSAVITLAMVFIVSRYGMTLAALFLDT